MLRQIAIAAIALPLVAGCGGLLPKAGTTGTPPPAVPRPQFVDVAGKSYQVAVFAMGKSGQPYAPPVVPPGEADVLSYDGTGAVGSVVSLHTVAAERLAFVRYGRVVAVRSLPACSVSCRGLAIGRAYDTVVVLSTTSSAPHIGATAVFR